MAIALTTINRFPVKSCRGESVTGAAVEPWGLAGDRRWMVVDATGEAMTARECPRMLLVHPQLCEGGLRLSGPGREPLDVAAPAGGRQVAVTVFGRAPFPVRLADDEAHAWFSAVIGEPVRLVYQDDPRVRQTDPAHAADGVSFADGYPLLLANEASLDELNGWIAEGPMADQGPLPMIRFRPNLVVRGAPAWAEDGWRRVRVGEAEFRAVKGCARCVIPTTNHETAGRGKEPTATLARFRRWDGEVWFAINLIPDTPGATVRVGDEVEILEADPDADGPLR